MASLLQRFKAAFSNPKSSADNSCREALGLVHLMIDETIVSELPDLLPLMLKAWPGAGAMVSSAPLSKCLAELDDRSADAAIVRLQGIEANEIGKLSALPLPTSLEGTMLLHAASNRA